MGEPMDLDVPDDFTRKSRAFLDWLEQNGTTISPKIELVDLRSRNAGRGIVARSDIGVDETLFTIPRSSILTHESSDNDFAQLVQIDDEWIKLIAAMMHEYLRGSESTWGPYFDVLPTNFHTLMFWSDDDLQYLEGSTVVNKVGRESADEAFDEHIMPLIQGESKVWTTSGLSNEELRMLYHRMGSTIMAYAFDLEAPLSAQSNRSKREEEDGWEEDDDGLLQKGMVPLADMLNADADRNNAHLVYEEDTVVMKSIKPIKQGDEIFNDYGPLPRSDLLRRYGYVTEEYAKYDVAELQKETVIQAATDTLGIKEKDAIDRVSYMEDQLETEDLDFDISRLASEDGPWTEELCMVLNAITMSKEDFAKLKQKEKMPKAELAKPSLQLLHSILLRRSRLYPSNDLSRPMDDITQSHRRMMARQVIEGEQSVLAESLQHVLSMIGVDSSKKRKANDVDTDSRGHTGTKGVKKSR